MGYVYGYDDYEFYEKFGVYGEKILWWGFWFDIILIISKVVVGYVFGSIVIIVDVVYFVLDIVSGCYFVFDVFVNFFEFCRFCVIWIN